MRRFGVKKPDGSTERYASYSDWKEKYSKNGKSRNGGEYYDLPRVEYFFQRLNFHMDSSVVSVFEKIGHLSIVIAFFTWLLGLWQIAEAAEERQKVTDPGAFRDVAVGRVLSFFDGSYLVLNPDGTVGGEMVGAPPEGVWSFEGGQFCRDFVIGDGRVLDGCHDVFANATSVRFLSADGRWSPVASFAE